MVLLLFFFRFGLFWFPYLVLVVVVLSFCFMFVIVQAALITQLTIQKIEFFLILLFYLFIVVDYQLHERNNIYMYIKIE